jgi:cytochrome c oxidase cbb3-type subunit 3
VNNCRHLLLAILGASLLCGCGSLPGKPAKDSEMLAPDQIMDFATLYRENCAGCHGADGKGGAAIALADPVYLTIADDGAIRKVVTKGERGTAMSAFAQSAGGMLTDKQIEVLIKGIRSSLNKSGTIESANPPAYSAKSSGDVVRGALVFQTFCESCHGPGGRGGPKGSSITNSAYLALVSDQTLRTVVITGRPELGAPDWRGNIPGKPMSEQEVTDVVAWLSAQRGQNAQQPNSVATTTQH